MEQKQGAKATTMDQKEMLHRSGWEEFVSLDWNKAGHVKRMQIGLNDVCA